MKLQEIIELIDEPVFMVRKTRYTRVQGVENLPKGKELTLVYLDEEFFYGREIALKYEEASGKIILTKTYLAVKDTDSWELIAH